MNTINLNRNKVGRALKVLAPIVNHKSKLSILQNVLFWQNAGETTVIANNLEIELGVFLGVSGDSSWKTTLPAKKFKSAVETIQGETIELATDTEKTKISCGKLSITLAGIDAQEFPMTTQPESIGYAARDGYTLQVAEFKRLLNKIAFAASTEEARPVLQGACLNFSENKLTAQATDGFRLASFDMTFPNNREPERIIVSVHHLVKVFPAFAGDETIRLWMDKQYSRVILVSPQAYATIPLIDGHYPDFQQVTPKKFTIVFTASRNDLKNGLKFLSTIEDGAIPQVYFNVEMGKVILSSASNPDDGKVEIECSHQVGQTKFRLNLDLISENINVIQDENITFHVCGPKNPIKITSDPQDTTGYYLIMPIFK